MTQRQSYNRMPVSLRRLFPSASFVGCADVRVAAATESSRECDSETLFAAIPGTQTDGSLYADEAVAKGACAILVNRPLANVAVPQCIVRDVRRAFATLCEALEGNPSRHLGVAGVTGTNGKTTTTFLIRSILQEAGHRTGLLGTVEYSDGQLTLNSPLTTPDSRTLTQWMGRMTRIGTTHTTLELSSHALDQGRAAATLLDAVCVTNITQDHFDYHHNFESYIESKSRILEQCKPGCRVVLNVDDPGAMKLRARVPESAGTVTFGIEHMADVMAVIHKETLNGSRFTLRINGEEAEVTTQLVGRHNISNCLAAAAAVGKFEVPIETIANGITALAAVPGRLESIETDRGVHVFVDYAHTDDALRRCVRFLKQLTPGRLYCVFGAGGDRDKTKRSLLGQAAAEADVAVVTSDNPRSEDPKTIIQDIIAGVTGSTFLHVEPDREQSIHWALDHAGPGDCVLVAGKGHETEQIIGNQRLRFDDREVIRDHLQPAPHFIRKKVAA